MENTRVRSTSKARVESETKNTDRKRKSNFEVRNFIKFYFAPIVKKVVAGFIPISAKLFDKCSRGAFMPYGLD
jgi:hypothetical protein